MTEQGSHSRVRVLTTLGVTGSLLLAACSPVDDKQSNNERNNSAVVLRPVDGGPSYYGAFAESLPTVPEFFPVALWAESVVDDTGWPIDKTIGANTYLQPTPNSDLGIIADSGMHAITSWAPPDSPTAAYFLGDEVDMWAGPGSAEWTGNEPGSGPVCEPATSACGYTVVENERSDVPPGRMTVANYGKGVAFWESDSEAARFVAAQDVASIDVYWFTDPNVCGATEGGRFLGSGTAVPAERCRLAYNYGQTVKRVRTLVEPSGSKPVWGFVEVGHPFTEEDAPTITAPEIRAAVWSMLVNGARGITYFVHNFAGDCVTQHATRDCGTELQQGLAGINSQIRRLAPVLNAPFVDGLVSADETVDISTKAYNGSLFVMAGGAVAEPGSVGFSIGCNVTEAKVVDENRSIAVSDGRFEDDFADGNSVHIYELVDAADCIPGAS